MVTIIQSLNKDPVLLKCYSREELRLAPRVLSASTSDTFVFPLRFGHVAPAQNGSFPHFHSRIEVLKARSGNVQEGSILDISRPCFQDLDPPVKVWKGSVLC